MEILIADNSGFCEGVERAYQLALKQAKQGRPVYMLGNLVHNARVVEKLIREGIKMVRGLDQIPQGTNGILLISAHGVAPEIYEKAKGLGLEIVDTTCPWVKKAQNLVRQLSEKGDAIVIVGDEGHPEVKGLLGWAGGKAVVVEGPDDLAGFESLNFFRVGIGVVAQTTQSEANFEAVVQKLREKFKDLTVLKTICGATSKRQNAAVELAKKVDLMLVVGDKMSANTKRLAELCAKTGTETHQIQDASELDLKWFGGRDRIGLTAGASTPDWVVTGIISLIRSKT
ncbi:MAG TPA: 4-hydroxy-3-methylbut-2-enyl diphosphate reductase [Candidatus Omnitrophota bacterium]|nr:4-hydroxy-3-methylbut-2-enyl diphosphate reductase [Candidatus Omnitrophota bacterium]